MIPTPWDDAGSAPHNNILGLDPGLRDPEHGDFRPQHAPLYGSRIVPAAGIAPTRAPAAPPSPPSARDAALTVGGDIVADTTWDAASVLVTSDVTVRDGAVLTVAPGVTVRFAGYFGLVVRDGALQAHGTPASPVVWTAADPGAFDAGQDTVGCWNGITFLNVPAASPPSFLRGCVLEYAKAVPGLDLDDDAPRTGGRGFDGAGGALRVVGHSRLEVSGCVLRHNCADRGGALAVHYGAAPLVVNTLLHDNTAWSRAGAVFAGLGFPRFVHDTVIDNRVVNPEIFDRTAGGIDHYHSRPRYVGCVVWGNETNHHDLYQILEPRAFHVLYSDVQDYGEGLGGLDLDPQFRPAIHGPGDLSAASPCRDAGDLAAASPWLPVTDLAGRDRVGGAQVDMGCYEFVAATAVDEPATGRASLLAALPNPANPATTLSWRLDQPGRVRLTVHDLGGRLVRVLLDGELDAGPHAARWDGCDDGGRRAAAGSYLARMTGTSWTKSVKILLVP